MSYVNLIAAISAAEKENGLATLDAISKEILQMIACASLAHGKIRVSDITREGHSTFPTVIGRLRKLADDGWITRTEDPEDKRVVLLDITPKTQAVFDKIYDSLDAHQRGIQRLNCEACAANIRAQAFSEFENRLRGALGQT